MEQLLFPHLALTSHVLPLPVQEAAAPLRAQPELCCTVSLGFSLCEPGVIVPAVTAWQAAGRVLPEGCTLDLGLPKQGCEWLLAGRALSAAPVQELAVHVQVGGLQRTFAVCGDRADSGAGVSAPAPFTAMPLDWAHTFGGPGSPANPAGRGAGTLPDGTRRLPNVCAWTDAGVDEKSPACPLPVDMRARPAPSGTFDAAWLATLWPAPPPDMDWSWYSLAQPAQRGTAPFTGLETIRIHGMHVSGTLTSSLPGLRLRVFADFGDTAAPLMAAGTAPGKPGWYEVQAFADTVWLFPNEGLGLQLWHALCPCTDERASCIRRLAVCYEDARGPAHSLAELLQQRQTLLTAKAASGAAEEAQDTQAAAAQSPAPAAPAPDLAPSGASEAAAADLPEASPSPEAPAAASHREDDEAGAQLALAVQQARDALPEFLAGLNPLLEQQGLQPLRCAEVEQQLARQEAGIRAAMAKQQARAAAGLHASGAPGTEDALDEDLLERTLLTRAGLTLDDWHKLMAALELSPPDPQDFASDAAFTAALEEYGDRFSELTKAPAAVRAHLTEELARAARLHKQAQASPPAPETLADTGPALAKALQAAGLAASEDAILASFAGLDSQAEGGFAGDAALLSLMQDISLAMGLDPQQGTRQLQTMLAGARRAVYQDAGLLKDVQTLLQHHGVAREEQLRLIASLRDAAQAEDVCDLQGCARRCGLVSPELLADLKALDPLPATPPDPLPDKPGEDLSDTPAGEAPRAEPAPQEDQTAQDGQNEQDRAADEAIAPLPADFSGRKLDGTSFAGQDLAGALFEGASLRGCEFTGCNLAGAHFSGADLTGAILADACLAKADLTGCTLVQADLSRVRAADATFDGCAFTDARLTGLAAEGASFRKAAARGADFAGCQLAKASFYGADLQAACFARAVLCEATFSDCQLDGADVQEADMRHTRIFHCSLDEAVFAGAALHESNWLACEARGLDMREAVLTRATLENCRLVRAQCAAISARECRFLSCELQGSDFRCADLLSGALRDCGLAGCDLSFASLFAADLLYARPDTATRFTDADLGRTILAGRQA